MGTEFWGSEPARQNFEGLGLGPCLWNQTLEELWGEGKRLRWEWARWREAERMEPKRKTERGPGRGLACRMGRENGAE